MPTILYRDGAAVSVATILEELRSAAEDAGVPAETADALLASALAGDACDQEMLENLIPGLECITEPGFGA